mmetsp:Transcript_8635/g.9885  ORF Transcript_8635/g.9885 Transcript_8635/m.9885 type:complete len:200 (-) Transcript_8635:1003-1602(-)
MVEDMFTKSYCRGPVGTQQGEHRFEGSLSKTENRVFASRELVEDPLSRTARVKPVKSDENINFKTSETLQAHPDPVSLQAKVKEQEKVIRGALGKQLSLVQEESKKLSKIQEALETLEKKQQKDIDILRNRIENTERELSTRRQTVREKEKAYLEAKKEYDEMEKEKDLLTSHLRMIIFENEKKKQEKLNELMNQLGIQ